MRPHLESFVKDIVFPFCCFTKEGILISHTGYTFHTYHIHTLYNHNPVLQFGNYVDNPSRSNWSLFSLSVSFSVSSFSLSHMSTRHKSSLYWVKFALRFGTLAVRPSGVHSKRYEYVYHLCVPELKCAMFCLSIAWPVYIEANLTLECVCVVCMYHSCGKTRKQCCTCKFKLCVLHCEAPPWNLDDISWVFYVSHGHVLFKYTSHSFIYTSHVHTYNHHLYMTLHSPTCTYTNQYSILKRMCICICMCTWVWVLSSYLYMYLYNHHICVCIYVVFSMVVYDVNVYFYVNVVTQKIQTMMMLLRGCMLPFCLLPN